MCPALKDANAFSGCETKRKKKIDKIISELALVFLVGH